MLRLDALTRVCTSKVDVHVVVVGSADIDQDGCDMGGRDLVSRTERTSSSIFMQK